MDIVLIKPRTRWGSGYRVYFGVSFVPLGLLQLAGDIRETGNHRIKILDLDVEDLPFQRVIDIASKSDLVGINLTATAAHNSAVKIAEGIKSQSSDTVVIAGGHHATFVPEELLTSGFDVVVLGEADYTVMELMEALEGKKQLRDVRGLAYKDREGVVRRTPPRPLIKNLDDLPLPAYDLIDREKYRIEPFGRGSYAASIETMRGCPYACEFCSVTPMWGHTWRMKSNARILREIELVKKLGYNWVFFVDDDFIIPSNIKAREDLFNKMEESGLTINFITQLRVDIVANNPGIVKRAAEVGMRVAFLGVESGDDETLKKMHKGTKTSLAERAVEILHKNGVLVFIGMILGSPYDTIRKALKSIRFAYKLSDLGADVAQFTIYTPIPGTRAFVKALREGKILTLNWEYYDMLHPVMRTSINPIILQILQTFASYTFYIRKWIKGKFSKREIPKKKLELLKLSEKYIIKRIPFYIKQIFLNNPKTLTEVYRIAKRREYIPVEKAKKLIVSTMAPVYADSRKIRLAYFKIL